MKCRRAVLAGSRQAVAYGVPEGLAEREYPGKRLDDLGRLAAGAEDPVAVSELGQRTAEILQLYIALAILPDGTKEIPGLWIEQTEGAKFWLRVMNEIKNRGVQDILLAVVDGLKGFPEAINATFPETLVQTCIVHLIRHSMNFASWKDRKHVA